MIGGTQDNGCVVYSGSSSWPEVKGGDGGWSGIESSNPSIMYCNYVHLQFRRSTDGGNTWLNATAGVNLNDNSRFYAPATLDPNAPGTIYLGGTHVYKTTNFAANWTDVSGPIGGSIISALTVAPSSSSTVYLGDISGNVKVSTNGGTTWQLIGTIPGYAISGLAVDPANANLVYVAAALQNTLYKFALQFGTWQKTVLVAAPDRINVVRINTAGALYVGTDHGAYYSTDSGATWASPGTGLPNIAVYDVEVTAANQLIAATHGRGVWVVTPTPPTPPGVTALTVSYSVQGGGSGYLAPVLSYVSGGAQQTAILGTTPNTYTLDSGSTWSISNPLSGSSPAERWQTNQATSGTTSSSQTVALVFYHQYLISVSYGVIGGGTPTLPIFSYTSFGSTTFGGQQSFWADGGGPFTATNPLVGSTSTERWYAPSAVNGTVTGAGTITLTYYHQFFLMISGANVPSQWYNSSSTASLSPQALYGRASGSGFRIVSYSIDGGAAVTVPPTSGTLNVQVVMNAPHALSFNSVAQYAVTLDSGAASSLNFITSPAISSDNYWYDAGSPVKVVLNGTWGRGSGSGNRLVSYAINGAAANSVATGRAVTVLSLSSIVAPQSVTTTTATQFELKTASGSVNSATSPTIAGDAGWYDQGTVVKVDYSYVWNVAANQSRLNAIGYDVDGGSKSTLPRAGNGAFAVTVTMDKPHAIDVISVTQYRFTTSGGSNNQLSAASPTNDGFYDSGSVTTVTTDYTWNVVAGKSRENLISYILDGATANVTRAESGTFTTPTISFGMSHTLAFNSVTQYFVRFGFTDNSGSNKIAPTNLQLDVNGKVENVSGFATWLDKGTTFKIASVIWEHLDVKPLDQTFDAVDMPLNETIRGRVFDAKLVVTDLLGIPVTGAGAQVILANGTQITKNTDSSGIINLRLIPLGTFTGSVSSLSFATQFSGDASQHPVTDVKVFASYPDLVAVGGGIAVVVVVVVSMYKLVIRRPRAPKGQQP